MQPKPQHTDVGAKTDKSALLCATQVSRLLSCSVRHVYRLSDSGRMPRPVKLGALVRWNRDEVERWIVEGCPNLRKAVGR